MSLSGSIDDCFDDTVMDACWARLQAELLYRRHW
jgi:hypothetical protein